ncbi:MAG TPA: autotransporter-associated beta strand repeat-containing protein, partial [bacterium]|nr:autotransporter-associated beta strand repeat-containing protein [bacterium]
SIAFNQQPWFSIGCGDWALTIGSGGLFAEAQDGFSGNFYIANTSTGKAVIGANQTWSMNATATKSTQFDASAIIDLNGKTLNCNVTNTTGDTFYNYDMKFSGKLKGSGTIEKRGTTGALVITGANNHTEFSGTVSVIEGVLALYSGPTMDGGSVDVGATGTLKVENGNASIGSLAGSGSANISDGYTLTTGAKGNNSEFSGAITSSSGAGTYLVKTGAGTFTISGNNAATHLCSTTVSQGTLSVTGDISGSIVTVNSGATIQGNGTVKELVLDGQVSPGLSPGTLNVAQHSSWNGGGSYLWEINDATGVAGTNWDLLNVGWQLNINANSGNTFTVALKSLTAGNVEGACPNFTDTNASWKIATAGTWVNGFDVSDFTIDATQFKAQNPSATGVFSIEQANWDGSNYHDINITYTQAVPEPSSVAFFALGILGLVGVGMKRMKAAR